MLNLILRRLLQLPIILAVIFAITFALAWLVPGNPLQNEERQISPEIAAAMQRRYHLDNPRKFLTEYLEGVFLRADFGPSMVYQDWTVSEIIGGALPVSVTLGAAAIVVGLILGTAAGVAGALRPGSMWDASSLAIALIGVSLPSFVTGSVLLVVFGGLLAWLPVSGWGSPQQVVLPAITLGLMPAAYIARLIRLSLADVMSSDFVRTARAKGLSQRQALFRHAFKVAFLPVLSFLGPAAAYAMTGSFVVEKVFNIPGLGQHFINAVLAKDQFLILGVVLLFSTMLVLFNLIVDVLYAYVDPRIELG
ncbi:MAG: ABC transporter permease [Phycisphaeraceae bacterium]|nr:ABC transporter permease [Phycisphaeraceae bacterium]